MHAAGRRPKLEPTAGRDAGGNLAARMKIFAYLDPGSGSMLLQALAGGAAAVAVMGKLYWQRLTKFLRLSKTNDDHA